MAVGLNTLSKVDYLSDVKTAFSKTAVLINFKVAIPNV